jgi:A/G-specific adenine glycosylase
LRFVQKDKDARIRRALLHWYDRARRDLPWRGARDPYAIWVAETMLQQTQVKTVLPYYRRFLAALPSVVALDAARREKVLALWSGLGYYRRALNLKKAARKIVRRHGGKVPRDFRALRELPGIGDYTAGALMSIAFGARYAALDGNARRVLARLYGTSDEQAVRDTAARLVPAARPGDFNQALMDLGATLCLPRNPECTSCPATPCCVTRSSRVLGAKRAAAKRPRNVDWPLGVIENKGRILLRRRSKDAGILPGLWEIPGGERKPGEALRSSLLRQLAPVDARLASPAPLGVIRHTITDRNIRAPVYRCTLNATASARASGWRWFPLESLGKLPLSSLSLKAARLVHKK